MSAELLELCILESIALYCFMVRYIFIKEVTDSNIIVCVMISFTDSNIIFNIQ